MQENLGYITIAHSKSYKIRAQNQAAALRTTTNITNFSSPNPEKGQVEKQNSGGAAAQVRNLLFGERKKAPSTVSCTLSRVMPKKAGGMHWFCNVLSCPLIVTALGRLCQSMALYRNAQAMLRHPSSPQKHLVQVVEAASWPATDPMAGD